MDVNNIQIADEEEDLSDTAEKRLNPKRQKQNDDSFQTTYHGDIGAQSFSLTATRDEYTSFAEFISNGLRNSGRPTIEIEYTMRNIYDAMFKLRTGQMASEISSNILHNL